MINDKTIDLKNARYWFLMNGKEYESLKSKTMQLSRKSDAKSKKIKDFIHDSIIVSNSNPKKRFNEDEYEFNGNKYDNFVTYQDENGRQHVKVGNGAPSSFDFSKWGVEVNPESSLFKKLLWHFPEYVDRSEMQSFFNTEFFKHMTQRFGQQFSQYLDNNTFNVLLQSAGNGQDKYIAKDIKQFTDIFHDPNKVLDGLKNGKYEV